MAWEALNQTWHFVERWGRERPDHEALVFGEQRVTWGDCLERMNMAAKAFLAAGVEKGDRVALLSMGRPEFITTYMAAGKVGAVWLGMSPKFTLDELTFLVGNSAPKVLVTVAEFMGQDLQPVVRGLMERCPSLAKVLVIGGAWDGADNFVAYCNEPRPELDQVLAQRAAGVTPDDEALLMYTSGSTGKPKGVVHTHRSIVENIKVEVEGFHMAGETRMLMHFPINHVAADVEVAVAMIMRGGTLIIMDKFDPAGSLEVIEKERVTSIGQIPAMFLMQFRDPSFSPAKLASVRQYIWAGSAAPRLMIEVLGQICRATGATMFTGYGSTEVCGFVTYTEPGDDLETLASTAGKIAPQFELKIVGPDRKELPRGEVGEIAVRGPFLMKGYFQDPEATARVIDADGWYYTSDLARLDERGYIHIAGRSSEMFKSGGENIYPREVEDVIEAHPAVLMSAVISVPDEVYQELGWAFVMTRPGQETDEETLRAHCKEKLANFKVPRRIFVRPMLPLLPTGKIDKGALRQEAKGMQ